MAERLKRAAAWLGLVTDDRYSDYDETDDQEPTDKISREELLGAARAVRHGDSAGNQAEREPCRCRCTFHLCRTFRLPQHPLLTLGRPT